MQNSLPDYDSLPPGPHGGRLGWHLFGPNDVIGLANLLTPEVIAQAAKLVSTGHAFPLDLPIGAIDPPLNPRRNRPVHNVIAQPSIGFDDSWDELFPQAGSQWDSLAHIGYTRETFYNGRTAHEIATGQGPSIGDFARHGIAGRAIVLDLEAVLVEKDPNYSPASDTLITVADLERARIAAGVDFRNGDALLIHTGFAAWHLSQDYARRAALPGAVMSAGLEHTEEMCRYLWNSHAFAVASDNFAVEAWPANTDQTNGPFDFIHQMLIGSFGMALGELWWLHDLVNDCKETGVWEGMLISAPLNAPGGISSTANAVVIK